MKHQFLRLTDAQHWKEGGSEVCERTPTKYTVVAIDDISTFYADERYIHRTSREKGWKSDHQCTVELKSTDSAEQRTIKVAETEATILAMLAFQNVKPSTCVQNVPGKGITAVVVFEGNMCIRELADEPDQHKSPMSEA